MSTAFSTIASNLLAPVSHGRERCVQARKKEQQGVRKNAAEELEKDSDVSFMD